MELPGKMHAAGAGADMAGAAMLVKKTLTTIAVQRQVAVRRSVVSRSAA
jgi:hypothetical protein